MDVMLLLGFVLLMAMVLVFHEVGHLFCLGNFNKGKQIKIRFLRNKALVAIGDWDENYKHLNKRQLFDVYAAGILAGFIPIWYYAEAVHSNLGLVAGVGYIMSIIQSEDIKNIWRLFKKNGKAGRVDRSRTQVQDGTNNDTPQIQNAGA